MTSDTELQPVPVRIVAANEGIIGGGARRRRKAVLPRTIVLTAASPVRVLLAEDLSRLYALVAATGNDVVLCESESQALDPANSIMNLPNPEGCLLQASAPVSLASFAGAGEAATPVTAGETIAAANGGAVIPAGTYTVQGDLMLTATTGGVDIQNWGLFAGATQLATLQSNLNAGTNAAFGPLTVVLAAPAVLAVKTIGLGSGTANYWAQFEATPVSGFAGLTPPVRIETTEQMWVTAQAFPAQVSILIFNEGPGY